MKYIEPSVVEIDITDPIDKIAKVARNCYLSTPKDPDEAPFVSRLINNAHLATVEHKALTYKVDSKLYALIKDLNNPFIEMTSSDEGNIITLSLRPQVEEYQKGNLKSPLFFLNKVLDSRTLEVFFKGYKPESDYEVTLLSEEEILKLPEEIKERHLFITMCLTTDRGVTHEIVRHRRCSFAQESTRYCNYSKNKFNNELTFIKPQDYEANHDVYDRVFAQIEQSYMELSARGVTPDYARAILPNSLKTSIMVTCNLKEWKLIFNLRTSKAAHPDMNKVMRMVVDHFISTGYIKENKDEVLN